MRNTQYRSIVLIAILLAGWGLLGVTQRAQADEARWPSENALYAVPGWAVGLASVDFVPPATHVVTRRYARPGSPVALVVLKTASEAKHIDRTGAEVGFLGGGYTVEPAPATLVPSAAGRSALIASRDSERWLVVYGYGERRGLLGNGAAAWGLAVLDGTLGHPNDYYSLSVMVRLDDDAAKAVAAIDLADALFPRVTGWYAE
jgi:hypothetical protein